MLMEPLMKSNARAMIDDDDNDFGSDLNKYFIMDKDTQLPLGFPVGGIQDHRECIIVL